MRCVATARRALARIIDLAIQHLAIAVPSFRTSQIAIVHDASCERWVCRSATTTRARRQRFVACAHATDRRLGTTTSRTKYGQIRFTCGVRHARFFFNDRQRERQRLNAGDASTEFSRSNRIRVRTRSVPSAGRIEVCLDTTARVVAVCRTDGPLRGHRARTLGSITRTCGTRRLGRCRNAFKNKVWSFGGTSGRIARPGHDKRHMFPRFRCGRYARTTGAQGHHAAVGTAVGAEGSTIGVPVSTPIRQFGRIIWP